MELSEVIAYTIGSFWYCTPCVRALGGAGEEVVPTTAAQLLDEYSYNCDSCGGAIRRLS